MSADRELSILVRISASHSLINLLQMVVNPEARADSRIRIAQAEIPQPEL
jgi:hypothetical protein